MKNSYLIIITCLVSIFLLYTLLFIYTFFNFNNEFQYTFQSLENLNFHEKYSKKIHHIRDEMNLNTLFKKPKVEDLLFTTITNPEEKEVVVLFQGDSWMQQLTSPVDGNFISVELVKKFKNTKKVGFINSYSFFFSPRPGTPANEKKLNNIEESEKRLQKLQNILENFQLEYNKIYLQQYCEVLIENKLDNQEKYFGRTKFMTPVI